MSIKQRSVAVLAVLALLAMVGCHDRGDEDNPFAAIAAVETTCADMFEAGSAIDDTIIDDGVFCRDGQGELQLVGTGSYDCPDGIHASVYNDWGRGVMPDGVWDQPFPADFTFDDIMAECP
jgi:hypothetical protein